MQRSYFNPYDPEPNYTKSRSTPSKQRTSPKKKATSSIEKKVAPLSKKTAPFRQNTERTRMVSLPNQRSIYEEASPQARRGQLRQANKLSPKQLRKNKKRRQRRFLLRVSCLMLLTLGLVWGGLALKEQLTYPKVTYLKVQKGTLDNSENFEGIVVRNEKVYYSKGEGAIGYIAGEGEKIGKQGEVCMLLDEETVKAANEEKEAVSNALYNAAENRKELSYYQDEDYQISLEVKNVLQDFYAQRTEENTDSIYTLRKALDNLTKKRTDLYIKDQKQVNNTVATQYVQLDKQLRSSKQISYAEQSGIVSYKIDGKEELLNTQKLEEINYEQYKSLREDSKHDILSSSVVEVGKPLYKLILDDTWAVISYMSLEEGEQFKEGEYYKLAFDTTSQEELTMKVIKKVEEEKRVQVVFETQEQGNKFLGIRNINFSIGNKKAEGLKIPLQSIVEQHMLKIPASYVLEKEGLKGVYRKKNELVEFIEVNPHSLEQDNVYVLQELGKTNKVQLEDTLVIPESGQTTAIKNVESIPGVYVINGKVAQFKTIEIALQNQDYALVKIGGHTELKELDKIISNPKSISKDQLLDHMNIQNE